MAGEVWLGWLAAAEGLLLSEVPHARRSRRSADITVWHYLVIILGLITVTAKITASEHMLD